MRRIRIVHCLYSMETGGAQVLAVELMNEMCNDHDVFLVVVNNLWSEDLLKQLDGRVKVYHINRKEGSRNPISIIRLNMLLLQLKPDVIHSHEPKLAAIVKLMKGKMLHTVHDVGITTSYYHLYDRLVAISDAVYNDVIARCNVSVTTVYNGIPTASFQRREKYALQQNEPVKLVQISRLLHEKKGQDILLNALSAIVQQHKLHFSLDFIGSGPSVNFLKTLTEELGLQDNVNFLGDCNRNWLYANLCNYHMLIQPSRYEGFGLTLLEGFAAGLPVIASNIDGPAEIVHQVPGGFLFEKGDTGSCARGISRVVDLYRKEAISPVMNTTRQIIEQKYSIRSCTKGYLTEYTRLVNC